MRSQKKRRDAYYKLDRKPTQLLSKTTFHTPSYLVANHSNTTRGEHNSRVHIACQNLRSLHATAKGRHNGFIIITPFFQALGSIQYQINNERVQLINAVGFYPCFAIAYPFSDVILGEKQDFPSPLADRQISIILIFPGNGVKARNGRLLYAKMKRVIDLPSPSFRFLDV